MPATPPDPIPAKRTNPTSYKPTATTGPYRSVDPGLLLAAFSKSAWLSPSIAAGPHRLAIFLSVE